MTTTLTTKSLLHLNNRYRTVSGLFVYTLAIGYHLVPSIQIAYKLKQLAGNKSQNTKTGHNISSQISSTIWRKSMMAAACLKTVSQSQHHFPHVSLTTGSIPILIRVYPRWLDLPHYGSNLSNSHSPSRSIQCILLLQTNTPALLLHLHFPCLPRLSSLPLSIHFKLQMNAFLKTCPSSLLNTCPYHLILFAFAIWTTLSFIPNISISNKKNSCCWISHAYHLFSCRS